MPVDGSAGDKDLKVAEMVQSGDSQSVAIQRAAGIWESRGVGNSYLLTTPEGDVLVNAGTLRDARRGKELFAKISQNAIRYIVLTQSHANQYGGLEIYKTDENVVVAHQTYPEDRAYAEMLAAYYRRGSGRIFGRITRNAGDMTPTREVAPDQLIGDDGYGFELGGRRLEVIHVPGGETRSAVMVWLPDERIAIVGNLFGPLFGNHPNLNTLRGDKPRSALQFISSVKKLRALNPELILTGHEAIHGAGYVQREVTRIIDAVQWVHDRTIEGMNAGLDLRTLMREVVPPPGLALTEEYGKVIWNVRAIWHEYTGWQEPARGITDLYGVPPSAVARAIAELAGSSDRLVERARAFVADGKPLEALHLLEIATTADPASAAARQAMGNALQLLDAQTGRKNLWERMSIAAALRELD